MHLTTILNPLITLLATTFAGDSMVAATHCWGKKCSAEHSVFTVAATNTTWSVNANDGCRRTDMIPDMSICVDWKQARAHYWYKNDAKTATKYCLLRAAAPQNYLGCNADRCEVSTWNQAECQWDTDAS